jgi:stage V sporulation protein D (sporulation-specific penicillin-binding protein)
MAAKKDYDPNTPFTILDEEANARIAALSGEEQTNEKVAEWQAMWRNPLVSDSYEPGSVFKMFTASMALEEGVVNLNSTFYCSGAVRGGPRPSIAGKQRGTEAKPSCRGCRIPVTPFS